MEKPIRIVLDTDAFNEVDDQFAIAYAMQALPQLRVEALYAAPFHNARSDGPADGMQKSYDEILRVLDLLGAAGSVPVFKGATQWLERGKVPEHSAAVADLIERGLRATDDDPLYVVGIAAATNLAAALLLEPALVGRVRYVWLGGQPFYWHTADEFNLRQDVYAAQVLFDSGVWLTHVPCKNVAEHLRTSLCELGEKLRAGSRLGHFLTDRFNWYRQQRGFDTKPLWDIAALSCLITPELVTLAAVPSPRLKAGRTWEPAPERHTIYTVTELKRDPIFRDLFAKLAGCP